MPRNGPVRGGAAGCGQAYLGANPTGPGAETLPFLRPVLLWCCRAAGGLGGFDGGGNGVLDGGGAVGTAGGGGGGGGGRDDAVWVLVSRELLERLGLWLLGGRSRCLSSQRWPAPAEGSDTDVESGGAGLVSRERRWRRAAISRAFLSLGRLAFFIAGGEH